MPSNHTNILQNVIRHKTLTEEWMTIPHEWTSDLSLGTTSEEFDVHESIDALSYNIYDLKSGKKYIIK